MTWQPAGGLHIKTNDIPTNSGSVSTVNIMYTVLMESHSNNELSANSGGFECYESENEWRTKQQNKVCLWVRHSNSLT